jgi:hypothetical protein
MDRFSSIKIRGEFWNLVGLPQEWQLHWIFFRVSGNFAEFWVATNCNAKLNDIVIVTTIQYVKTIIWRRKEIHNKSGQSQIQDWHWLCPQHECKLILETYKLLDTNRFQDTSMLMTHWRIWFSKSCNCIVKQEELEAFYLQ